VSGWRCSVDTGGTFTDCLLEGPDGALRRGKVLSSGRLRSRIRARDGACAVRVEPLALPAPVEQLGGRRVWINGAPAGSIRAIDNGRIVLDAPVPPQCAGHMIELDSGLEAPVLALRMLLPDAAAAAMDFRLGTTKGTNALLENKGAPAALFLTEGFSDLLLIRDQKRPRLFARAIHRPVPLHHSVHPVAGRIDAAGRELAPLDCNALAAAAEAALQAGCTVAAVCLLHSWINPVHEQQASEILQSAGFAAVRLSSSIRPLIKYLDRAETTLVDAALAPVMDRYLDRVERELHGHPLWIMTSAGGLVSRERFNAVDSLVSGPAGGMLGAIAAGRRAGMERIIALDMGGTSTDVSRWRGRLELRQRIRVGAARILTPAMPIETVAAGGGSICRVEGGRLWVGPESAGADPGPAAYGAGGPLTLTDIHLLLGRLDPAAFSIPIRMEAARAALDTAVAAAGGPDWRELAEGFLAIATERMAHAIRKVSLREGEDPAQYGLVAFGGAGGLHACRVAEELGIREVLFPEDAGLLSARGIHDAPREAVVEEQLLGGLTELGPQLQRRFALLGDRAARALRGDGVAPERIGEPARTAFLRLAGQEQGLPVEWVAGEPLEGRFRETFVAIFGYYPRDARLELVKLRLHLCERVREPEPESFDMPEGASAAALHGPAALSNAFGACHIEPGWTGIRGSAGSIRLRRAAGAPLADRRAPELAPVTRTLAMNRLEGLVEEMGDQLQRTAISTNIRERLDFSCALLDEQGRLLVNAPHIPVHLGALGLCVRECAARFAFQPGDVLVTNHPAFGGSHLPDITLICGLFDRAGQLIGHLANRAHHAELGGRSPGSMPADATHLAEEGVVISPQWLLREGKDRFDRIDALLRAGPWPSRSPRENRIDLEAQVASLQRGRNLFDALLDDFPADTLRGYLDDCHRDAARALASALAASGPVDGTAECLLDDGHAVRVRASSAGPGMCIDFTGTSPRHPGNLNATPAIVRSAVLYVLRLLVDTPMPLNEGLLDAVEIRLPECFLNPGFDADPARCPAVVGGNVETSQRVVEALLRALGLMAASQGTMNNLLFGNARFGYYETIGGGAGAGDGFDGASGVHVHMTNTAITDPEILEQRFPVICREFSLRSGSGGAGRFRGGDGLVRELAFREPVTLSLLSQGRVHPPRGMAGGQDGAPGRQWRVGADGSRAPLPGICRLELEAGEGIRIETPGGGGWGNPPQA
jgi:5-oxoprolinase (ATP-hydrolysing)